MTCMYVKMLLWRIDTHHSISAKGETGTTRTVLLHGDKNGRTYILERAQKQLGEHSSPRQEQRKKNHMKETRRVCDICPQQPFTLPDTPWQHCENTLTFLRRETTE